MAQSQSGLGLPEKQDDVDLNTPAASTSTSEEVVGEERLPLHEEAGHSAIEVSDTQEAPLSLSPFEQNGSIRSNNSWLQGRSKSSKQKKGGRHFMSGTLARQYPNVL